MPEEMQFYVRNIKKGFATNSSSYHNTMILTQEEFDRWDKGENIGSYKTRDAWYEKGEHDEDSRTLPSGERVVVLTRFGYDG